MDEAEEDRPAADDAEVAELRSSVIELSREVQILGDRVARLGRSIEALAPAPAGAGAEQAPAAAKSGGHTGRPDTFLVVVSPVSELALAAVAETTLRGLPAVRRMMTISRSDDEARFELELDPDTDLLEPLRSALPVPFDVCSSSDHELVISLRPAWGPATAT